MFRNDAISSELLMTRESLAKSLASRGRPNV